MATDNPTFRFARRTDVLTILTMMRELAAHVDLEHEVIATEADLQAGLFFEDVEAETDCNSRKSETSPGSRPQVAGIRPARCLLLFNPAGEAVGMAIYYVTYSTWRGRPGLYLEDLFVRAHERGKGYGTMLLSALAREVSKLGGERLEWSVLEWNEKAIQFYKGLGAELHGEWRRMRVDGQALDKLGRRLEEAGGGR